MSIYPRPPVRVAIPTMDRPDTFAMSVASVSPLLRKGDELVIYDDGFVSAFANSSARFAIDIALSLGASVRVERYKPSGIGKTRARILRDAHKDNVEILFMLDDDVVITSKVFKSLVKAVQDTDTQYAVPIVALANNESKQKSFGDLKEEDRTHQQQFLLNGTGIEIMSGGAWTCAIMLNVARIDMLKIAKKLENGPPVGEDYVMTYKLLGVVDRSSVVWHCQSDSAPWGDKALKYLREQLGENSI